MSKRRTCGALETRIRTSIGMIVLLLIFWYPLIGIRSAFGSKKPDVIDLWYDYKQQWKILLNKFIEGKMTYQKYERSKK